MVNFETQSGVNLPPSSFHAVFAKNVNYKPKAGH
jgi:hypothetical protein